MTVVTYSHARQNFASLLNRASKDEEIIIKRQDGTMFLLKLSKRKQSPLDVKGVSTRMTTSEIVDIVRASRCRGDR